MKISKDLALKYFKICSTVVSSRDRDELLYRGVRVQSKSDGLVFSAFGNFNAIKCIPSQKELENAEYSELDFVIEAGKTIDILNKSTKKTIKLQKSDKQNIAILTANGRNQLRYVDSINIQKLPAMSEKLGVEEIADIYQFLSLLEPFTSEDIHRTQLLGVCISKGDMYGTDERKALTLRDTGIEFDNITISIDLVNIFELLLSYEDTPKKWELYLTEDGSFFVLNSISKKDQPYYQIYIHRYNIEYPVELLERANEMTYENECSISFKIKDVLNILDRISIFSDENDLLFIKVKDNKAKFIVKNLKTSEKGEETISVETSCDAVIPVSLSSFKALLSNFQPFMEVLEMNFSMKEDKNFVSFNYEDFDAWLIKNVIDFEDDEI